MKAEMETNQEQMMAKMKTKKGWKPQQMPS
jgi:hypothetical protein